MPLNPSIPLGVQPMQLPMPNPNEGMNALARVMQIRGMQDEQKLNALKFDDAQRTLERKNKLDSLLQQDYATPEDRETALVRNGFVTESGTLAKNRTDAAKAKADADKNSLDMALKKAEHVSSVLSLAKDPQSYATVRAVIKNQFGQDLPEQFDPNVVGALVAQGQTITQKLADLRAQQTQAITMRGQDMTAATARRGQDITVRGQNLVDQRARETVASGRVPAGYRQKPDGTLEFIPGGPADPNAAKRAAPTEFQGKAGMFGARAQEADKIITDLQGKFSPAGINSKQAVGRTPLIGGALEAGANLMLSDESQKAEQAQRDFINAVLRLESGAAIADSEFANAQRQYFPQPGDSAAVIAQKAQNRKTAIQGLANNARPGAVDQAPSGGPRRISSDADYNALPSGAEFIAPDGSHRRKP